MSAVETAAPKEGATLRDLQGEIIKNAVFITTALAILILIVLPVGSLLIGSMRGEQGFSLNNFVEAVTSKLTRQALVNSMVLGGWTAFFSVIIGVPLAWAVSRANVPGKPLIYEGFVKFQAEFSVILVRTAGGDVRFWDSAENVPVAPSHLLAPPRTASHPFAPLAPSRTLPHPHLLGLRQKHPRAHAERTRPADRTDRRARRVVILVEQVFDGGEHVEPADQFLAHRSVHHRVGVQLESVQVVVKLRAEDTQLQ